MIHVTVIKKVNNIVPVQCRVVIRGFISVHIVRASYNGLIRLFGHKKFDDICI